MVIIKIIIKINIIMVIIKIIIKINIIMVIIKIIIKNLIKITFNNNNDSYVAMLK